MMINKNFVITDNRSINDLANFSLQNTIWNRIRRWWNQLFRNRNGWYYGTLTSKKYDEVKKFFDLAVSYIQKKYGIKTPIRLIDFKNLNDEDKFNSDSIGYCYYDDKEKMYLMYINPRYEFDKNHPMDDLICHELSHAVNDMINGKCEVKDGLPILTHGKQYQDILEDLYKEFRIPIATRYKDDFILISCNKSPDFIRPSDINYWREGCLADAVYINKEVNKGKTDYRFAMTYLSNYNERSLYCIALNNNILSNVDFKTKTIFGFKFDIFIQQPIWRSYFCLVNEDDIDKFMKVVKKKYLGKRLFCYVVN